MRIIPHLGGVAAGSLQSVPLMDVFCDLLRQSARSIIILQPNDITNSAINIKYKKAAFLKQFWFSLFRFAAKIEIEKKNRKQLFAACSLIFPCNLQ